MSYPIIPVFIPHAGCPHDCVFCNQKRIAGTILAPEPSEVSALLAEALQKTDRAEVAFYGGSFTAIPPEQQIRYLQAVRPYGDRISGVRVSTRPDAVDPDILSVLKAHGVKTVELGVQSMRDRVLAASGRGHTAADTERAVRMLRDAEMPFVLQMMPGLPGDDDAGALATARKIAALRPDGVRVYPTVVIRDTQLETLWRCGDYEPLTLEHAIELCAKISQIFEEEKIPVIRMGLNPTEELSGGDALAGAYHPAFGQLVFARRRLWALRALLDGIHADEIVICANPRAISEIAGHHGENRRLLCREFGLRWIKILPDDALDYQEMRIIHGENSQKIEE